MERSYDRRTGTPEGGRTDEGEGGQSREMARQKTSEYAEQGRERAVGQLATQKERASEELGGVAQALRATGEQLREQEETSVSRYANYVDQAAERTERFSKYLHEKDANALVREAEDFARSRPAIFLGGAFAVGIAAARFLKSSAGQREGVEVDVSAATSGSNESAVRVGEERSQR